MTTRTLRLAEVKVGDTLPELSLEVTPTMVVAGAIASRDFTPVHHDTAHARSQGELGEDVHDRHLLQSLLTLFYGVPAVESRPDRMQAVFARSVQVVLKGHGLTR